VATLPKINPTGESICRIMLHGDSSGDEAERSVIRVYAEAGNVIETHEQAGDFKEW
jgi:hypothetical protein